MTHPYTSTLITEIAGELGLEVLLEPKFRYSGRITYPSGMRRFFHLSTLDCNGSAAARIASDKDYSSFFLNSLGYSVPEGKAFFSNEWCRVNGTENNLAAAIKYAAEIGWPIIVKPNSRAQGNGVHQVSDATTLERVLTGLFIENNIVLVQRVVSGRDYRAIVYRGKTPIVYERTPLTVTGDSKHTIREIIDLKIASFAKEGREVKLVADDPRIVERLKHHYRLGLDHRPAQGETVQLLDNANLSSGGTASDLSASIHPSFKSTACRVAGDTGLNFCGIDIMTNGDPHKPLGKHTIIEVNDHPGLEHYSALGAEARERVRDLYREILAGLEKH